MVGWNLHCRNLYKTARLDFLSWHENGRPRIGVRFEKMKLSRSDFRNALNYCRKNESKIRKEILLAKFNHNNKSDFWKELRKLNGFNRNNLSCIDGTSDPKIIAEIFDTKYSETLKDPACQSTSDSNPQDLISEGIEPCSVPLITFSDINYAIDKINVGLGWDKIHANHLKFNGQIFRNLLCKIYNKFLSHEYLPQEFLAGRIKPVLKSNCTSKTDSSNFRPVMNSSNFLKVFEHCLLPFLLNHLNLSNLQFGFRSKTGCNSAIAILKETIFSYINDRSNVHCAMVDLSKAFDKINHDTLINKMRCTNLPNKILNIISFMLRNTFVNISCNSVLTDQWKVGNGTRQGHLISFTFLLLYKRCLR